MNVSVDHQRCISCGLCADLAPALFRIGESGLAEAYAQPTGEQEAAAEEAANSCPVAAIRTEE